MALFGKGVLAIWNGIAVSAEADFVAWHVAEHIPERVGLPGFLRGRRYVAVEGRPKYFNFYETETPEILTSAPYRARLDDPTPWTRQVVAHFVDTSRTVCDVVSSVGRGEGGWLDAIQLRIGEGREPPGALLAGISAELAGMSGICGVHLLRGRPSDSGQATAEAALRGAPDATVDWVLLVEAVEESLLRSLRAGALGDGRLIDGGAVAIQRGLYRLQFSLSHAELAGQTECLAPRPHHEGCIA